MIDDEKLDELLHYCKKLDENGELAERIIPSVLIELIARLRQAEKDAARYRWLRGTADVDGDADLMISIIASDEWDSLIDKEIQCNK